MSDTEEENFCYFGRPLDPYDEDSFPKKKPISVEDQIATDTQGRRRFHGAFTGGFSAGFFNTVGSLEGWTPSEFKSTRQDKAKNSSQKPEDFMDDEDFGEYGIAHQTVKATKEYSTVKKRKRQMFPEGPIPGEPVLETLLSNGNETIGYLLLKNIGIQEKIASQIEATSSEEKVYGCQMPSNYQIPKSIENKQYQIPKMYETFLKNPKSDTFGLGYKGLDKSHLNLFQSTSLVMKDRNNKNISIKGQAFGVGAFEDEDEDIYVKDDMSKYDFELTKEKVSNAEANKEGLLFGLFKPSKNPLVFKKLYSPPTIPQSFTGKHKVRKSRFEPIAEEITDVRTDINPTVRAEYLGENVKKEFTKSKPIKEVEESGNETISENSSSKSSFDVASLLISDRFVSAGQKEVNNIWESVPKSETTHGTSELREAARMKMFGRLTRVTSDWHPNSILCKRFNVPEPFLDQPEKKNKKRTKNLIFEYQKQIEDDILKPGLSTHSAQEVSSVKCAEEPESSVQIPKESAIESDEQSSSKPEIRENIMESKDLPKDITEKVDIADKLDLFKTIFLSSSESEHEDDDTKEETAQSQKIDELKANVLSDSLIPKIKPIKEGILSNVNFHAFSKPNKITQENVVSEICSDNPTTTEIKQDVASYGPALPNKKTDITKIMSVTTVTSDSEDEWIEKGEDNIKKFKSKKKHKKEKHKKHKREKKKSKHK